MSAGALRLFVAVDVPTTIRAEVYDAAAPLRSAAPAVSWSDPATWHLTLAFLAAVPTARLDEVVAALRDTAGAAAPLRLALNGRAGSFPGVVWAGLEPSPALGELAGALRRRLAPLGYEDDRPFRAHLTLARSRRRGDRSLARLAAGYRGPTSTWVVDRLTLWQSRLQRGGSIHDVVVEVGLGVREAVEPPADSN